MDWRFNTIWFDKIENNEFYFASYSLSLFSYSTFAGGGIFFGFIKSVDFNVLFELFFFGLPAPILAPPWPIQLPPILKNLNMQLEI